MFLENKYSRIYFRIVEKSVSFGRNRSNGQYFERHHIVPKSLGGTNAKTNIVLLTAREHFICHWLLTKFTASDNRLKMLAALGSMSLAKDRRRLTSKQYEIARAAVAGPKPAIHRTKLSIAARKSVKAVAHRKRLHTDLAIKMKKSASMTVAAATEKGKAQRAALAAFNRERKYLKDQTCAHCGAVVTMAMYTKLHGDRCSGLKRINVAYAVNGSGERGVRQLASGAWQVRVWIKEQKRDHHLGTFPSKCEAIAARDSWCARPGSNRHKSPYEGLALPVELRARCFPTSRREATPRSSP